MTYPKWYHELFTQYQSILEKYSHLYIALSAGIDSNILLHWLYAYRSNLPPITAIHVNHQLHGDYSQIWADFAKERAHYYGFPFINYDITLDPKDPMGTEAAGRKARYIKFAETMKENSLLIVAHHRSDQAETVFHRLTRGAGVRGLGAMRIHSTITFDNHTIKIFRPFLTISKKELYHTGKNLNLPWMEDYTNHEEDYTRNQIRNGIFPKVAHFFPAYEESFTKSALFLQEAHDLLTEIAQDDLSLISESKNTINRSKLLALSPLKMRNLLRHWLGTFNCIMPSEQFHELYQTFIEQTPTHQTQITNGVFSIRYFQDRIYLLQNIPPKTVMLQWIHACNAPTQAWWNIRNIQLIPRIKGCYFHPMTRHKKQSVKKLLQEANIPTWERINIHMLIDSETKEILWIEHLGLSYHLQDSCEKEGVLPTIAYE